MIDVRKLLEKGQAVQDAAHAEQEATKRGNLRGGSAGVIGTDGKIYGECHRVALARTLGADKEHEANRSIMFDAGNANEDSWATKLKAAGIDFRREDEIPIVWPVPGTTRVATGRPDIVIGHTEHDQTGKFVPEFGLELKGVFSAGTAVKVEIEGIPDSKHLCQAAFYSMALGIPYALCYTNPAVIETPYWAQKKFSAPKKIQPFYRMYYLRWEGDTLEYKDEQAYGWIRTVYTKQGIADYFTLIDEMERTKQLGPRPEGGLADGSPPPYNRCDYCPMQSACDPHEDDYDAWLAFVKSQAQ